MDTQDLNNLYEAAIDVIIIGVFGVWLTVYEAISYKQSFFDNTIFALLSAFVVFSVSYMSRRNFIYRRSIINYSIISIIIILILIIILLA